MTPQEYIERRKASAFRVRSMRAYAALERSMSPVEREKRAQARYEQRRASRKISSANPPIQQSTNP